MSSRDLAAMRDAGFADAAILHALLQSANFGHLNRIADAVGVAADYPNSFGAPQIVPSTPPYLWPTDPPPYAVEPPFHLGDRDNAHELYGAWRSHVLARETGLLDRRRRAVIAYAVAERLGDPSVLTNTERNAPALDDLDRALVKLADIVTLAPWQLAPTAYIPLRALGLADDADVFDAVATASSCTVFSRIETVLSAFSR